MENGIIEKEIELNSDGLKAYVIFNKGSISFSFDKSYSFLTKILRIEKVDNITFVYLGLKKLFRIQNGKVERIYPITSDEIKVLSAIYNSMKQKKEKDLITFFKEIKNNVSNSIYDTHKKIVKSSKGKTEYQSNLVEMLSSEDFVKFLNEYTIKYPMDENGKLDFFSGKEVDYKTIVNSGWAESLHNSLRADLSSNAYNNYQTAIKNREKLLRKASERLEKFLSNNKEWLKIEVDLKENIEKLENKMIELDNSKEGKGKRELKAINDEKMKVSNELTRLKNFKSAYASSIIYNELLNAGLNSLSHIKVDNAIISTSNENRIIFMSERHKNDNRFKFIYSIDRLKTIKGFRDAAKDLESLLCSDKVIGIDIFGLEDILDDSDFEELKEKLEWILPVLHIHIDSTLRINASDFSDCSENIYKVLKALKEVNNRINEACVDLFGEEWGLIPPPRIRIGSLVDIEAHKELINLLKDFDATVELNSEVNSKVKTNIFDQNNIDYIYSTDGGQMYYHS